MIPSRLDAFENGGSNLTPTLPPSTLDWLIHPANASSRWFTLKLLLGKTDHDPRVAAARQAIPSSPWARTMLPLRVLAMVEVSYDPRMDEALDMLASRANRQFKWPMDAFPVRPNGIPTTRFGSIQSGGPISSLLCTLWLYCAISAA